MRSETAFNAAAASTEMKGSGAATADLRRLAQLYLRPAAAYSLAMLDWAKCESVERVPGRVSGAWVFKATRLPVSALFENIEAGATVDEFLSWYEGVTREQVLEVLRHAERSLAAA